MSVEWLRATWAYLLARYDVDYRREEGLTTSEVAVLTVLLVGGAIAVALVINSAASNNADNIPQP